MAIVRWQPLHIRPWGQWPRWFDEGDFWPEASDSMNVYETDDEVVVEANVPGIPEKNIDVTVEGGVVTIRGELEEKEEDAKEKGKKYFKRMERRSFHYSTTLPCAVKKDAAVAEVENGVLTLRIPKSEEEKPKRIEVKVKK